MIEERDLIILAEVERLVARFGPDAVTRVVDMISDPGQAAELAQIMEFAVTHSSPKRGSAKSQKNSKQKRGEVGASIMKELASSDPEKHAVLSDIRDQLLSGVVLQSMAEIRRFARKNALSIGTTSSRVAAIVPILRALSSFPVAEIASIRDSMEEFATTDRSLERLRNVIVHPQNVHQGDPSVIGGVTPNIPPR